MSLPDEDGGGVPVKVENSRLAVKACNCYDLPLVIAAMKDALYQIGGLSAYISSADRVLLKINLLRKHAPEDAVTTHPVVIEALCRLLMELGVNVIVADTMAGGFTEANLKAVYSKCGIEEMAARCGATLNYDTGTMEIENSCQYLKKITTMRIMQEVDKVISVPKLKTHSFMVYTGAVKNMFGMLVGKQKTQTHYQFTYANDFANALLDICETFKPVLCVMDAIVGMEGHGPSAGTPRDFGFLMVSNDPHAMDYTVSGMIGFSSIEVPTLRMANKRGLLPANGGKYNLLGDSVETFTITDLKKPPEFPAWFFEHSASDASPIKTKLLYHFFSPYTVFRKEKCISCEVCMHHCPVQAISMKDKKANVDYSKCIRCFCCQELCPVFAVEIHKARLSQKVWLNYQRLLSLPRRCYLYGKRMVIKAFKHCFIWSTRWWLKVFGKVSQ